MAGRLTADCWVHHLREHLPAAQTGTDPEALHQTRVALARLQVWLTMARQDRLKDEVKWLRAQAGPVRDLGLQLEDAPAPLRPLLQRAFAQARGDLLAALAQPRTQALLDALSRLTPLRPRRARKHRRRLLRELLRRGRRATRHPDDIDALHDLRRAARRLRFTHEWLGARPRRLIKLQDALGAVVDHDNALQRLEQTELPDPTIAARRAQLADERSQLAAAALRRWRALRRRLKRRSW